MLMFDGIWLTIMWMHLSVLQPHATILSFAPVIGFLAYRVIVSVGFRFLRISHAPATHPKLLLLRVFSAGRRSERLFDALSKRWLRIGSISLVAGPDLLDRAVAPHEFLAFLSGQLSRRFVGDERDLNQRVQHLDALPDPDGRYRVTEFYCRADNWKPTVSRLIEVSDVIAMDLRGFSAKK